MLLCVLPDCFKTPDRYINMHAKYINVSLLTLVGINQIFVDITFFVNRSNLTAVYGLLSE